MTRTRAAGANEVPPFQEFLERNRVIVYRFLVASVGPGEADDCFQETFLAALRAYPRLRDGENLRGWVLTIATRKAIDASRRRGRRAVPMSPGDLPETADAGGPARGADVGAADPEDPLWRAVRGLPPRQRAAVVHRYVLDRAYADVAAAMGSSEETARANVSQGLKRLRKELDDA
jgi:RNA polymerase sigma factor (sigma-70 family)